MSHHYSGPDFGFPHGDARLDFTVDPPHKARSAERVAA